MIEEREGCYIDWANKNIYLKRKMVTKEEALEMNPSKEEGYQNDNQNDNQVDR